jgi:chemotaxis protein methyltransferase CheR
MTSSTAPPCSDREFELVRTLVRERSGIELPDHRRREVDGALHEALRSSGAPSVEQVCRLMAGPAGRRTFDEFLDGLIVAESHFFRTKVQFDALEREVLPDLVANRRDVRRLRVWSAGCAAGEEPYSIAILLDRLLRDADRWDLLVLGTDISHRSLEAARRGLYRRWAFRETADDVRRTYFVERGDRLELLPKIRDRVTLASLNLVTGEYPAVSSNTVAMDLVLCRNVLIYFDEAVARRVVARLAFAISEGGWLVLAPAEASLAESTNLIARRVGGTMMHQKRTGCAVLP